LKATWSLEAQQDLEAWSGVFRDDLAQQIILDMQSTSSASLNYYLKFRSAQPISKVNWKEEGF
jgi:hypothetical protein